MLLLDTCTLIWLDSDPDKLSEVAKREIRSQNAFLFVSSISALEVAIKCRKGKLTLPLPPEQWFPAVLAAHGLHEVPLEWSTSVRSAQLPLIHADPFDRIIVATAQVSSLTVVTPDPLIHAYPDTKVVW